MKKINVFCLVVMIIIFIYVIFQVYVNLKNDYLLPDFLDFDKPIVIIIYFLVVLLYFNLAFLPFYFFVLFLNYNRNANYRRINNNEVDYVRDLPKYNSAVASYLYDGIIDVEKDCKALLMELTYAKYLIFNDGKYTVDRDFLRKNPLPENNQTSRYLIDILLGYKVFNEKKFKSYVFDDCKKMNLIKDYDLLIVAYIFFVLIGNLFQVLIIVSLFAFTPLIDELGYKVTELGALERDKLIKLKAFLHDFSNIKDVKSEDANIWDEFLPYAVVLEENNNFIIE